MKRSVLISWLFMLTGALIYLIGLWQACPLLSGKGYFLGVLITSGLLLVGLWNAPLSLVERGAYLAAFCLCISGQYLLMRVAELADQPTGIDTL